MGHDTHFLSRLERVEGAALNLALGLYRDPNLLRVTLAQLPIGEAEVVALPLAASAEPPHAIVSRQGKFITCLAAGMHPAHAAIARWSHLQRLMAEQHALRDLQTRGRERMKVAAGRLFSAGPWLAREDMEDLLTAYSLLPNEMRETSRQMVKESYDFKKAFRPKSFRAMSVLDKKSLSLYWKTTWAAAHCQIINVEGLLRMEDLYPGQSDPRRLVRDALRLMVLGYDGLLTRACWIMGRLGALALADLETWFEVAREIALCRQQKRPEPESDPSAFVGGTLAPLAFLAIATRHPEHSADIEATLRRLLGPQICQEIKGMNPIEVANHYAHISADDDHITLAASALAHLQEADQHFPSSRAALWQLVRDFYCNEPLPAHPDARPVGPPLKRKRPDLPRLDAPPSDPFLCAPPFGLYSNTIDNAYIMPERLHLLPALASLNATDLFFPRACLDDLEDSMLLSTPVEPLRDLLTSAYAQTARARPAQRPATPARNDPCTCGSGQKYKKCCGA